LSNPGPEEYQFQPLVVLLDAYGSYFWYPQWTENFSYERVDVNIGTTPIDILDFEWPNISGEASGILFYAALLTQDLSSLLGDMDSVSFGWAP